ncbi:MAG: serine/threonine protein kinase [Gemmataceae bacterium]
MDIFAKLKGLFGGNKKSKSADPKKSKQAKKKPTKSEAKPKTSDKKKRLPKINVDSRFELLGRTGQGSMSKVWRARDKKIGRTVCLKVLDKEKTKKFEARFQGLKRPSEGEILELLQHRNIVKTYEHGLTNQGEQYIVMALIEGVGLNFLVETKSKQLEGNRVNYLIQVAEGLEFMHQKKFLHRDICPRNIMVTSDDVVQIIDLGLSIPYTPDFCKPGNRTGTPDYLAPELIKRETTDHRVDLFALGVTAYEMFTGGLPWEKADSMQTLMSHMNMPGRDPLDLNPDLDDATVRFLRKAVERRPKDRFQTAAEFAAALKELET